MRSIRLRLFAILLATTGAVWLLAVSWTYFSVQHQVQRVLDARLVEAARMVSSLITDHRIDIDTAAKSAAALDGGFSVDLQAEYRRQLSCQIWSLDGHLISRSESAPQVSLAGHSDGLTETTVDGERWRVYAVVNPTLNIRVLVGDSVEIRDKLVADVVKGQLVPAVAILPILAILIWISVGQGLIQVKRLAASLSQRSAEELHAIEEKGAPSEIKPLLQSINALFLRVETAREREKTFIAYAAHELKTPLAGLKTQAQVALRSSDEAVRSKALSHISTSVDRTGRLVRQLIDLASVDSTEQKAQIENVRLRRILDDIRIDLEALRSGHSITVEFDIPDEQTIAVRDVNLLRLALRNVIENAVQHSPEHASVRIETHNDGSDLIINVVDQGKGIARHEQPAATQRFERGSTAVEGGSGLGLAIVDMAMRKLGGSLAFQSESSRFIVGLAVPQPRPSSHGYPLSKMT